MNDVTNSSYKKDILIVILSSILIFFFFVYVDFFETALEFIEEHEEYELDEAVLLFLSLPFTLLWYVYRRYKEIDSVNIELLKKIDTEVKKRLDSERVLQEQSRYAIMGEMIGNIAHQWRQPLNALGLLLQNIENAYEMEILDEAYIQRSIAKGNRLTTSMSQTIDDFRNFFKPNKETTVFSIGSSIKSTLEIVQSSYENNTIEIITDIDESLCVKGFPSEFSQVILNIMNNARDALLAQGKEHKVIKILVYQEKDDVAISVEDTAGGIPEHIIGNVFNPYFTTKHEGKGTGIGLYMSKSIIEKNMNGILSVKNNKNGACFKIKLQKQECVYKNTPPGCSRNKYEETNNLP